MKDYDYILKLAINKCNDEIINDDAYDINFDKIYPYATENITGYIDNFNLIDKSLLTVGSSCDQAINAIFKGCNDITILDINPYTEFYYYLKVSSILALNYDEFFIFLCPTAYQKFYRVNNNLFDKDTFNKIKETLKSLNYKAYLFWNELFSKYNSNRINRIFTNDVYSPDTIKKCNPYLSSELAFNKLKNFIKDIKVKFEIKNIFDIDNSIKYDNIWLSNIGNYLNYKEIETMVEIYSNLLKEDGKLLISYLYRFDKNTNINDEWICIYNIKKIYEILKNYKLSLYSFDSICENNKNKNDSILTYQKRH